MEEAIDWPRPPIEWHERLAFVEPIGTPEDLARALSQLAERLCVRLAEQDKGGRRFVARFFRVDEDVPQIAVTTALAVRDAGYLTKLLREKLDTVDPGFGIEVIALEAEIVAPLRAPQTQFSDLASTDATDRLAGVVDTLTNRLGSERCVACRAVREPCAGARGAACPAAAGQAAVMGGRSGRTTAYPFAAPAGGDRGDCAGAGRSADPVQLAWRGASGARRRWSRADRRRMVARQAIGQTPGDRSDPRLLPC